MMDQSTTHANRDRQVTIERIQADPAFDVVIIGAGINGAGLFRELCLQGVKVLLVDRKDICAGASSAPSRLIHGGIKYLETGEFRLVAQSTLERNLLLRNAPHYVRPLPTVLPIYSWFGGVIPSLRRFLRMGGKMTDRGVAVIELGLQIYDFLGRRANVMPRHTLTVGSRSRARWPSMDSRVLATGRYYDAAISQPERLGAEIVLDGLAASPSSAAVTYMAPEKLSDGELTLRDIEGSQSIAVKSGLIVNSGGAWIDRVNQNLGISTAYIGGTKGSHLVLRHPDLFRELGGEMVYFGTPDGRICLAYPFFGNVLVGSTDIRIDNPDDAICSDDEQAYMLRMLSGLFPGMSFEAGDVLYRYCGVRPLPATDGGDPGAISRDHLVHSDLVGKVRVLSLVGGKWTTFRGLSEEVADIALAHLGRARAVSSRNLPIGGGRNYPLSDSERSAWLHRMERDFSLPMQRALTLFERYGTRAASVAAFCAAASDNALTSLPDFTQREFRFLGRNELVVHLSDIVYRRTAIALEGRITRDVLAEIAASVAPELGWSEDEVAQECEASWLDAIGPHHVPYAA